jgi:surface protein
MAENYAIMPLQDYESACNAIREKTGGTDPITSGEMAAQIQGISGGAGYITNADYLFYNEVRFDELDRYIDLIRGCTSMAHMFAGVSLGTNQSLKSLSRLDTSNVTSMKSMFDDLYSGYTPVLDISTFSTSRVTDMSYMFRKAIVDRVRLGDNWDMSSVTTMCGMFEGSRIKEIDLTPWDTSCVTDMSYVFKDFDDIPDIDVSKWVTTNVAKMNSMFYNSSLAGAPDFSGWDTSRVTDMSYMFYGCKQLISLNVSNFDTSATTSMMYMFSNCGKLESIIGFSATNKIGMSIGFPYGSKSSPGALKRLTFRTDLPADQYAIRSAINIKYCSFERSGMVEMFGTLPDVSALGLTAAQTTITITGNPCVTDGTLTDADRSIATGKGWTLVE